MDRAGQTPLSLAYSNRHLETVKYLVQEQQCDPECMLSTLCFLPIIMLTLNSVLVNEDEDMPLLLECSRGHLDWIKALINKHIDPKSESTQC